MTAPGIAIQMYTVRSLTASDMAGTLASLARIGYRAVEFAGYGNASPPEVAAALQTNGIAAIAAHVSIDRLESDMESVFDEMETIGCPHIVVPWLKPERRAPELAGALAQSLNATAKRCHDRGFAFSYHNHDFEFAPLGPGTYFDFLAANTDPALVTFELDLYWAAYSGVDPVALIQQFSGRAPLLHAKDMVAENRADAPVGQGVIDWQAVRQAGEQAGAKWYIVEQDNPSDPMSSAAAGLATLEAVLA